MGNTLPVTLSHCFMNKIERDIVLLLKPKFYRRLLDETDEPFSKMNPYYLNINLRIAINTSKTSGH